MSEDVVDTSDYKLDKRGRKIKAHRIVFNKGEDDGKKAFNGVNENMKKSFNQFVVEHSVELTEEELNELVVELQEVLGKSDSAGKWISDFVHSDNPKFAGKSKEKRKQMALAAYYSAQRNEELKGGQVKLDKNKNGKLDKQDFKLLRKEEQEIDEGLKPEHNMRPGWMLKADPELAKKVKENQDLAKKRQQSYGDAKVGVSVKEEKELDEASPFDYKNTPRQTSDKSTTMTKHDVKKTSTGTVYTKQRDADGMSKEFNRSGEAAQKRGRGRPKKSSFGEAVEFLMTLSEEQFDEFMSEGFDSFMEHYEQLDELSKSTLVSYVKKANSNTATHGVNLGHAIARGKGTPSADKIGKRIKGVEKAADRLAK